MRRSIIIGILVMLIVTVLPLTAGTPGTPATRTNSQYNLDFSSYPVGSYPANLSWVNFHNVDTNQYSTMSVIGSKYGNGLLESTQAYHNLSSAFLDIGMSSFSDFTLKITFTWSKNSNYAETGDNIILENNSRNLMQYKFGPYYNNSLYLTGKKNLELGAEPPISNLYTLQITGCEQNGAIYTGIAPGFNQTSHTPIMLKDSFYGLSKNYSILIGGGFSNLTIYNIYLENNVSGFNTTRAGQDEPYNETNLSSVYFPGLNSSLDAKPVVDWEDNSILYATKEMGPKIYSYNFYNNSQRVILDLGATQKLLATAGTSSDGYFLVGNDTGSVIYNYDYNSGFLESYSLNLSPNQGSRIYPVRDSIFIQSENGSVFVYNLTSRLLHSGFTFKQGTYPLQSWTQGTSLITQLYSNSTGKLSSFEVNPNGNLENISSTYLGEVDFLPSFSHAKTESLSSASSLELGVHTQFIFAMAGESFLPIVLGPNFSILDNAGTSFYIRNSSGVYIQERGYLNLTNINGNSQFLNFDQNLTKGLSVCNRTITIYSKSGEPFSPDNISMSIAVPDVLRGNASIAYSISSRVNYTVNATLGGRSLVLSGGYANFSTSGFSNGTYLFSMTATNIAGYSSTFEKTITVDNYHPIVTPYPANGSLVLSYSRIRFAISNISGEVHTNAIGSGGFSLNFSGDAFNITAPGSRGRFNLSLIVVDQFGLSYRFSFGFHVEALNISAYSTNIKPGAYLPIGNINLSWTGAAFASSYKVTIVSNNYGFSVNTLHNFTNLDLPSGFLVLYVNATGSSCNTVQLVNESFTVQDFDPSLSVRRTHGEYFSFYGDSPNSSLDLMARTNVTSRFWVNSTGPMTNDTVYSGNGTFFNFSINRNIGLFRENGLYNISVTAKEMSGRLSTYSFKISVNNSIPRLLANNSALYFNKSYAPLPIRLEPNATYWYVPSWNLLDNISLTTPFITLNNLSTTIVLGARTVWGNFNMTSLRLFYSNEHPGIYFNVSPGQLVWSKNITITYSITDPVNLSRVTLTINNRTESLGEAQNGTVQYTVDRDGTFNFTLAVSDLCGNTNTSETLEANSYYFPQIMDLKPHAAVFMGIVHLSSGLVGNNLESVNMTWSTGGKVIGEGSGLWTFVLPGSHTFVLKVQYHSVTVTKEQKVFTLGFLPELSAGIIIAIVILYRKYAGKPDSQVSRELVNGNLGKSRKEVYRIARKTGIRAVTLDETIKEMQKSDEVALLKDPDGTVYIMDPKNAN